MANRKGSELSDRAKKIIAGASIAVFILLTLAISLVCGPAAAAVHSGT